MLYDKFPYDEQGNLNMLPARVLIKGVIIFETPREEDQASRLLRTSILEHYSGSMHWNDLADDSYLQDHLRPLSDYFQDNPEHRTVLITLTNEDVVKSMQVLGDLLLFFRDIFAIFQFDVLNSRGDKIFKSVEMSTTEFAEDISKMATIKEILNTTKDKTILKSMADMILNERL